jgi:hypothetical protein
MVATRTPESQVIGAKTVEELINERTTDIKMTFTDLIGFGVWFKIPPDSDFNSPIAFLGFFFSEVGEHDVFNFSNKILRMKMSSTQTSFGDIDLSVLQNQWVYLFVKYKIYPNVKLLIIKINDLAVYSIKIQTDLFKNGGTSDMILSFGCADFRLPSVSEYIY